MNGFSLPRNFTDDPEKLLKKKKFVEARDKFESPSRTPSAAQTSSSEETTPTLEEEFEEQVEEQEEEHLGENLAPVFENMVDKTLRQFSTPTTANIRTGPTVNTGENGFELKLALITMVQASQFYGKGHEDASAQHFLEIYNTFTIRGVSKDAILLYLFSFSLLGKAKQWFYINKDKHNTWDLCSTAFLAKLFPTTKANALRGNLASFQQQHDESFTKALERIHNYIEDYPHHGIEEWLLMQTFYDGIVSSTHESIDVAARGAFLSLKLSDAKALVEKMASNSTCNEERT